MFGLQDPLYPSGGSSDGPIEDMAAVYVAAIRSVQPHGPYHLLGWCFGGKIAFEMACQLRAAGEEVALLAVLDATAPGFHTLHRTEALDRRILAGLARELGERRNVTVELVSDELAGLSMDAACGLVVERLKAVGLVRADHGASDMNRALEHWWLRIRQQQDYQGRSYPGRITLFLATGEEQYEQVFPELMEKGRCHRAKGWDLLSTETVEVHDVPGQHATIGSEPHVQILAARVADCLTRARAEHAATINA